ncbi:FmdB family transcriptional regulator [Opitutia bacterium ISCC 51]|nr:FmdB family transcriptional regulator [Opitutae bacterium ISCC 51]QXD29401.1 FmdB family transcriptional regulator [Opitutae bacterium ISCC 52]
MPVYSYRVVNQDGSRGEHFEVEHSMSEPTLEQHPITGEPIVKIMQPPNLGVKHTVGSIEKKLDNKNVEKAGFTKYEKDKLTGNYFKSAGTNKALPETLNTGAIRSQVG